MAGGGIVRLGMGRILVLDGVRPIGGWWWWWWYNGWEGILICSSAVACWPCILVLEHR